MVSDDELQGLVSDWYGTGQIADEDLLRLKERYLADLGATTCTTCPSWKTDMLDHFRRYLRALNKPAMSTTKYKKRIKPEVGSFFSPSHGTLFTNTPSTSSGVTQVTDEIYDALMAIDKSFDEHFEDNPDYVEPEKKETGKKKDEDLK